MPSLSFLADDVTPAKVTSATKGSRLVSPLRESALPPLDLSPASDGSPANRNNQTQDSATPPADATVEALQLRNAELADCVEMLEADHDKLMAHHHVMKRALDDLHSESQRYQAIASDHARALDQLHAEKHDAEKRVEAAEALAAQALADKTELEAELAEATQRQIEESKARFDADEARCQLSVELERTSQQLSDLRKDQNHAMDLAARQAESFEMHRSELALKDRQIEELRCDLHALQHQLTQAQNSVKHQTDELRKRSAAHRSAERRNEELKHELDAAVKEVHKKFSQLKDIADDIELLAKECCGNQFTRGANPRQQLRDVLVGFRETRKQLRQQRLDLEKAHSNCAAAEDKNVTIVAELQHLRQSEVEMKSSVESVRTVRDANAQLERENAALQSQIEAQTKGAAESKERIESLLFQVNEVETQLSCERQLAGARLTQIQDLARELESSKQKIKRTQQEVTRERAALQQANADREQSVAQLQSATSKLSQAEAKLRLKREGGSPAGASVTHRVRSFIERHGYSDLPLDEALNAISRQLFSATQTVAKLQEQLLHDEQRMFLEAESVARQSPEGRPTVPLALLSSPISAPLDSLKRSPLVRTPCL